MVYCISKAHELPILQPNSVCAMHCLPMFLVGVATEEEAIRVQREITPHAVVLAVLEG